MQSLFAGLYFLSYCNIGRPKKEELESYVKIKDSPKNITKSLNLSRNAEVRSNVIQNWLINSTDDDFLKIVRYVYNKGEKSKKPLRFSSKRIWCCIRDYLKKGSSFREIFKDSLDLLVGEFKIDDASKKILFPDSNEDNKIEQLLELPGDTWNNDSTFGKCFLGKEFEEGKLNRTLRVMYDEGTIGAYPEQFDITFSFVPRMCSQNKCTFCPMYLENDREANKEKQNEVKQEVIKNFNKLCCNYAGNYCPAVLMYTGYIYECAGKKEECDLWKMINNKNGAG